jgi:hypothetical protein
MNGALSRQRREAYRPRSRQARVPAVGALVLIASILASAGAGLAPSAPAEAADPAAFSSSAATRYQVTFAARSCAGYDQVMANQVRGNGAESLARPGRASTYKPGQPVDPDVESAAGGGCQPLTGWRFTLGPGLGRSGPLSVVTGATVTTPPTADQAPRLNSAGGPTGSALAGAVSVTLTEDQLRLLARRQLYVQGGTTTDPLLAGAFGPPGYGFAVLRCGVDGHGGANVQWLGFVPEARHAYCFAYYVRGPAAAGEVTVRVRPTRPVGYPQRFGFSSPLSFADGGRFSLASGGDPVETTFTRPAAAAPYPL